MPDLTDHDIVMAMRTYGGSFIRKLAELWALADDNNRARLKVAFAGYWHDYRELAEKARAAQ